LIEYPFSLAYKALCYFVLLFNLIGAVIIVAVSGLGGCAILLVLSSTLAIIAFGGWRTSLGSIVDELESGFIFVIIVAWLECGTSDF